MNILNILCVSLTNEVAANNPQNMCYITVDPIFVTPCQLGRTSMPTMSAMVMITIVHYSSSPGEILSEDAQAEEEETS